MSSIASPFGLRPSHRAGGIGVSLRRALAGGIPSGYATAIGENSPIKLGGGNLVAAVGTNAGDSTGGIIGAFAGVEYTDANGRRQESNQWLANTVATNIIAFYYDDPYMTYEVQANGTLNQTAIGSEIDFNNVTVNTTTGQCTGSVDTTTLSSGAQRLLRIIGITPGADNAFGDAFTIVQVQIAKHQWVTPVIGVA